MAIGSTSSKRWPEADEVVGEERRTGERWQGLLVHRKGIARGSWAAWSRQARQNFGFGCGALRVRVEQGDCSAPPPFVLT